MLDAALMGAERRLSRLRCLNGHIILAGATAWFWNTLRDWLLGRGGAQSQHHIRQLAVDGGRRAWVVGSRDILRPLCRVVAQVHEKALETVIVFSICCQER